MKSLFLFSLMTVTALAWSANDWKVVAESTTACKDKLQVLAKEGEKFVYVVDGDTKTKLSSTDGAAYSEQSGRAVEFSNKNDKNLDDASKRFTFNQPSMVDPNPPKLDVSLNGLKDNCKMILK